MTDFPRWRYWLVGGLTLLGLLLALPNVFGEDPALQVALAGRDKPACTAACVKGIEDLLHAKGVNFANDKLQGGQLLIRFASRTDQLKAKDVFESEGVKDLYNHALTNAPRTPAWMQWLGLKPMKLGLDLRGGSLLVFQVDIPGAVKQLEGSIEQDLRRSLREAKIQYTDIVPIKDGATQADAIRVTLRDAKSLDDARKVIEKVNSKLDVKVDDNPAAPSITARVTEQMVRERSDYAIDQNLTTLRNRINELGVSEPQIQRQGRDRIAVQLPGVDDPTDAKRRIGSTASLEVHLVDEINNPAEAQARGVAPLGSKLYLRRDNGGPVLLKRDVIATGDQFVDASFEMRQEGPAVNVKLDNRGGRRMGETTRANLGHRMAVVYVEKLREEKLVDGQKVSVDRTKEEVISDATIQGVFSNNFQITGLGAAEAPELAKLLRAGALAAPLYLVEERTIGPSLGEDNIRRGMNAMMAGMLTIFVFMAIYYKVFGLVANLVLLSNVVLLTAFLSAINAVLSLPGIGGIVLTVGMAVDANILIYERIREELRNGVSPRAAIDKGFDRAFTAIADSNVTTLIAGVVLWAFGSGPVRGFAVVLTLGILTSLFTAIIGSRVVIHLIYTRRREISRLSI
jgi:preprotein translocase subunit SecD